MNIDQKTTKINMFFGHRFGVALGWVLEGVWEAKNLNFRTFFDVFSKQILKEFLAGQKIEKNGQQSDKAVILRPARRNVRGPGER